MSRFRPVDRKTAYLLPPSVEDWLPEGHLARFIVESLVQLNLTELARAYAGRASAAYHPEVMLGLLVYGYATGVFSSRKIERATYDSVAFRYLAAGSHPDHDTLATFRRRFLVVSASWSASISPSPLYLWIVNLFVCVFLYFASSSSEYRYLMFLPPPTL